MTWFLAQRSDVTLVWIYRIFTPGCSLFIRSCCYSSPMASLVLDGHTSPSQLEDVTLDPSILNGTIPCEYIEHPPRCRRPLVV
uniref:Uncharacterized protein n=1 Tax=Timema bartmani TaxID=61472 RepID=A0A7R9I4L3_9NEOP|nr:unnamed protein product [Timema bartmani]